MSVFDRHAGDGLEVQAQIIAGAAFSSVSSSVIPFVTEASFGQEGRASLSLYVNGELKKWSDENKKAFGVLLAARYANGGLTLDKAVRRNAVVGCISEASCTAFRPSRSTACDGA